MSCYRPLPISFVRGEGAWLVAADGGRYLDAIAGLAVCGLGHAHPRVAAALATQAQRLLHVSNCFQIAEQQQLGERLSRLSGMDRVFFCNSGTEANEAALKLVRRYAVRQGNPQPVVVVAEGAFHGRTFGALSASAGGRTQDFGPLLPGFIRVPYGSMAALADVAADAVVAVMLEPIQGEAGVRTPPEGYLRAVRALCDQRGWLLILDEVQTGLCRTGRWFAWMHEEARPDVLTVAKALANGVPAGACLARQTVGEFARGEHGSTFGGNPLAARVALEVLDVLEELDLAGAAARLGQRMLDALRRQLADTPGVRAVRGRGLMIGVELEQECRVLSHRALEHKLLINVADAKVIRLLPPLIISDDEADQIVHTVVALVADFTGGKTAHVDPALS